MNKSLFGKAFFHIFYVNLWTNVLFNVIIINIINVIVTSRKYTTMQGVVQRKIQDTIYVEVLRAGIEFLIDFLFLELCTVFFTQQRHTSC